MKLLVVKLSSMGDVIHTFAAIADAKTALPELRIDWCVDGGLVELARLSPDVATVFANDAVGRARPLRLGSLRQLGTALRAEGYDLVIDAQGLIKSAVVSRLAGAPVAGYNWTSIREPLASLAYRYRHAVPQRLHAVKRMRLLFGAALGYQPDLDIRREPLRLPPSAGDGRVFLLHGTTAESKRWPLDHWVGLARHLAGLGLIPTATWSNDQEQRLAVAIRSAVPAMRLVPPLPIAGIAAEIFRASLVVGVDTGLAHLADAAGVPTVMLFQASSPELTGPLGARSVALTTGGVVPARPLRRLAQLPPEPSRIVPVESVAAAVTRLSGQFA